MAIKFTMIDNRDLYGYECPECGKPGQVSGDAIDIAKKQNEPLELNCGHNVAPADLSK
jgi:hypothetical protein